MSLTVVMPTLGRPLFTLRSLWYLNAIKLPWRIVVADGGDYPTLDRLLRDRRNFPELELTHFKRRDVNVRAYYQKCLETLRMVTTPYVLMHDNDDFFTVAALSKLAAFLDGHPDHAAVGGVVASFYVDSTGRSRLPFIQGGANRWAVMYDPKILQQPTATERVERHLQRYFPTCYCLHRTSVLTAAYEFLVASGISDLPLHEIFLSLHTLLPGKITTDCSVIGYMRQANTSEANAMVRPWSHRFLQQAWQADLQAVVEKFSTDLHRADPATREAQAEDLIRSGLGHYLRTASDGTVYHGSSRGDVGDMLDELRRYGAGDADCAQFEADLPSILRCLEGDECRRFITEAAPDLVRQWRLEQAPHALWTWWKASPMARWARR